MTTETNNSDSRVSDAYRALATDTTPPELDQTILKMAASHVPTRYGRVRGWLRPVAWAATIGLSLAFILDMSRYQDIPVAPAPLMEKADVQAVSVDAAVSVKDEDIMSRKLNKHADAAVTGKALATRAESAMPAAMESAVQRLDVAKEQAEHCDAAARDAAESWYSCIEGLREYGLADAARQELEALLIAFPDFREPEQDK